MENTAAYNIMSSSNKARHIRQKELSPMNTKIIQIEFHISIKVLFDYIYDSTVCYNIKYLNVPNVITYF